MSFMSGYFLLVIQISIIGKNVGIKLVFFVEKDIINRSIIPDFLSYSFYHMICKYISTKVHLK